ncbi:MAG: hypothetical protein J0I07_34095 [Myxococcales bacterium]|nr:hypothetical protein [Myxococcales bacterium]
MTRSSPRRAVYAAAIGGCLLLSPRDVRAEAAVSRIQLSYDAPPGCPSRQDFLDALRARTRASWLEGSDTRSFEVRVGRDADGRFSGRLEIHQADRSSSARVIRGDSCSAVTTSLAVFVAIALVPESGPAGLSAGEPRPTEGRGGDGEAVPDEIAAPTAPLPPRSPTPSSPGLTATAHAPSDRAAWIWSAGYAVSYLHAPEPSWGGRVHAELARGYERAGVIPALRVSWGWSDFSRLPALAGGVSFRLQSARVEGCARLGRPPIIAAACAGADIGTLAASTPPIPRVTKETTPWTAGSGIVRATWSVTPWLTLELSGGLLVPFERPRFMLGAPTRLVYRAPAVVFEGSAGIGAVARFR